MTVGCLVPSVHAYRVQLRGGSASERHVSCKPELAGASRDANRNERENDHHASLRASTRSSLRVVDRLCIPINQTRCARCHATLPGLAGLHPLPVV
jgi:hypothetical protein